MFGISILLCIVIALTTIANALVVARSALIGDNDNFSLNFRYRL